MREWRGAMSGHSDRRGCNRTVHVPSRARRSSESPACDAGEEISRGSSKCGQLHAVQQFLVHALPVSTAPAPQPTPRAKCCAQDERQVLAPRHQRLLHNWRRGTAQPSTHSLLLRRLVARVCRSPLTGAACSGHAAAPPEPRHAHKKLVGPQAALVAHAYRALVWKDPHAILHAVQVFLCTMIRPTDTEIRIRQAFHSFLASAHHHGVQG
jgi:hypothetical protein